MSELQRAKSPCLLPRGSGPNGCPPFCRTRCCKRRRFNIYPQSTVISGSDYGLIRRPWYAATWYPKLAANLPLYNNPAQYFLILRSSLETKTASLQSAGLLHAIYTSLPRSIPLQKTVAGRPYSHYSSQHHSPFPQLFADQLYLAPPPPQPFEAALRLRPSDIHHVYADNTPIQLRPPHR